MMQSDYISIIKSIYPTINKEAIKVLDDGWDYVVCVVNNIEAFRFPRRDDYTKTLPREVAFLEKFSKQSPVQVPKLTLHKMPNGKPFVTYPFISGVQFKGDLAKNYKQEELYEIAHQIGNFLSVLHSFPISKAKELGFEELDSIKSWSDRLKKVTEVVYPYISESERTWTNKLFINFIEIITQNPFKNRLTHSDIMPEHIIVDPETHKLTGIIDFGDAEIADPAYDFAFLRKYGQSFLDNAYAKYKLARDETFEKRRQFYEDRLVVTNLEHSIELKDKERTKLHKKQLTDYITNR